jgi:hypothetical protein
MVVAFISGFDEPVIPKSLLIGEGGGSAGGRAGSNCGRLGEGLAREIVGVAGVARSFWSTAWRRRKRRFQLKIALR